MAPSLAGDLVSTSLELGRKVGGTSNGDGFEWRDFRADPDGISLGAAAGALVVVGVYFGKVEGAGAITVTSDGATLGAGAGLDKLVALDGTTLGAGPGAGTVVAAADRTCLGTSGGNRGDGVLLVNHEGASAPRELTLGPRMAPLRESRWGRLAAPRLATSGTEPGSWLGLATGASNCTGLGGLLGDTTGALRASWGVATCGPSTGTLAFLDLGGLTASSWMDLRCSASTGTDKMDGALAWTSGGQGHGKKLHPPKVLFFKKLDFTSRITWRWDLHLMRCWLSDKGF
jgi:hypothetical protein